MAAEKPVRLSVQAMKMSSTPPVSQAIEDGGPILGALIFPNPHAQYVFPAIQIDSIGNIDCLFHNLPLAAEVVMDGIQKYHRIDALQGPLLPFPKSEKQTS